MEIDSGSRRDFSFFLSFFCTLNLHIDVLWDDHLFSKFAPKEFLANTVGLITKYFVKLLRQELLFISTFLLRYLIFFLSSFLTRRRGTQPVTLHTNDRLKQIFVDGLELAVSGALGKKK